MLSVNSNFIYFQTFPDKNKLIQIMTGLLGHIAELEELRPRLMDVEYIDELSYLSLSMINGFEVITPLLVFRFFYMA